MKCFYCEKEAVAICRYCGKALCRECGDFIKGAVCKDSNECKEIQELEITIREFNKKELPKYKKVMNSNKTIIQSSGIVLLILGMVLFFGGFFLAAKNILLMIMGIVFFIAGGVDIIISKNYKSDK